MPSLISSLLGKENAAQSNEVIANTALAATKANATAYFAASMESATPEVRRLYEEYMAQAMASHGALTQLAVTKGWYKPYDLPENQLKMTYDQSQQMINQIQQ
jgi:spore coat protein CotF